MFLWGFNVFIVHKNRNVVEGNCNLGIGIGCHMDRDKVKIFVLCGPYNKIIQ